MVDKILKWKLLKLAFILKLWLVKKFYETALMLLKKKRIFVFNLPNFILFSLFSYINFYHMARTQSNFVAYGYLKASGKFYLSLVNGDRIHMGGGKERGDTCRGLQYTEFPQFSKNSKNSSTTRTLESSSGIFRN